MIQHATARRIASAWHGGGGSALYALCSTGAIDTARDDHHAEVEIIVTRSEGNRKGILYYRDSSELRKLQEYVNYYGKRGPIDGWGKLWPKGRRHNP